MTNNRKTLRLKYWDYSSSGYYFVTICTRDRQYLLGHMKNSEFVPSCFGVMVPKIWNELEHRFQNIKTDEFILMPDHIHGIIYISPDNTASVGAIHELPLQTTRPKRRNMLLSKIIGYLKMNTAKQINRLRDTPGTPVWQRNYYEHIIRNENELFEYRKYIQENPLKWESDPEYLH